jgi:hypothetical protein
MDSGGTNRGIVHLSLMQEFLKFNLTRAITGIQILKDGVQLI